MYLGHWSPGKCGEWKGLRLQGFSSGGAKNLVFFWCYSPFGPVSQGSCETAFLACPYISLCLEFLVCISLLLNLVSLALSYVPGTFLP